MQQVVNEHGPGEHGPLYNQFGGPDATASALWALCRHWGQPEAAIVGALHCGGDTDSVPAMVGALAGAAAGCAWLPSRWYADLSRQLNAEEAGVEALVELARRLSALDLLSNEAAAAAKAE